MKYLCVKTYKDFQVGQVYDLIRSSYRPNPLTSKYKPYDYMTKFGMVSRYECKMYFKCLGK